MLRFHAKYTLDALGWRWLPHVSKGWVLTKTGRKIAWFIRYGYWLFEFTTDSPY